MGLFESLKNMYFACAASIATNAALRDYSRGHGDEQPIKEGYFKNWSVNDLLFLRTINHYRSHCLGLVRAVLMNRAQVRQVTMERPWVPIHAYEVRDAINAEFSRPEALARYHPYPKDTGWEPTDVNLERKQQAEARIADEMGVKKLV